MEQWDGPCPQQNWSVSIKLQGVCVNHSYKIQAKENKLQEKVVINLNCQPIMRIIYKH